MVTETRRRSHMERSRAEAIRMATERLRLDVGERLWNEELRPTAENDEVLTTLRLIHEPRSIGLVGHIGTGKDMMMLERMQEWVRAGHSCRWFDATELLDSDPHEAYIADVICLSDPIPIHGNPWSDWKHERLWKVVDQRYRMQLPTCFTVNVPSEGGAAHMTKVLGARLCDRLFADTMILKCNWESLRKGTVA